MRKQTICERGRAPVRLRVTIDGTVAVDRVYTAGGLYHDGVSIALERVPVARGTHDITVEIGDTRDGSFGYGETRQLSFRDGVIDVVLFDRTAGFSWVG
jgi:hypothetical protein